MNSKQLVIQYFEALKGPKSSEVIDKYVSDEDQELKNHIEVFEAAFPGYELLPEDIVAEGDRVAVRFNFVGVHKGQFMDFAPTHKEVSLQGMIFYQIQNDKIINHWMVVNMAEMIDQLQEETAAAT
jgi:predicted ester cyclase